jgi:alkanesulfonate monooxygenase SsuD/methylene tetrahydromethanopterin reductase-like flavin-dependent oxidoreductase (luciferase family)
MACTQPESFRLAGSLGLGALSFGFIAPGVLEASLSVYRQALGEAVPAGAFINNQFAATTFACVAPTDEEALASGRPAAEFFQQSLGILFVPWGKKENVPESYQYYSTMAQLVEQRLAQSDGSEFDQAWESGAIAIGDPSRVRKVVESYEKAGVDQLILMVQAGRITHESCMQTIQLFGDEIIPHFK